MITPSIGTSAVGSIEFTSPGNSDSVLAVRDGKTVLPDPGINFVSLEHLAQKMAPLVLTRQDETGNRAQHDPPKAKGIPRRSSALQAEGRD